MPNSSRGLLRPFFFAITAIGVGAVGSWASSARAPRPSVSTPPRTGQVWQLTYLKARPGEVDRLATFISRNWFVMDSAAQRDGRIVDYQLLRGTPADTSWDLLEITVFADSLQEAQADSIYATVYRPRHRVTLIDGKPFSALGRITGSTRTVWRAGRVGTPTG